MVDVTTEIIIGRPVGEVAAYAEEPDNAVLWYDNIAASRWISPKPLRIGSQFAFTAHFMGRDLSYTYEVVEYIPREKLVMRTAEGPFPMQTSYSWYEVGSDHTLMVLRNSGRPKGFSGFFAPLMSLMMKRANKKDLRKIKKLLES